MKNTWLITLLLLWYAFPAWSLSGITYHGRIVKPDGVTPVTGSVQFKLQIRTPTPSNCLMYEEWQTIDLDAGGIFSLTINDGTGTRQDSSGLTIDTLFANQGTFSFAPSVCGGASTYTPSIGDGRMLKVSFRDTTMSADEDMPIQALNFAPLAIEAQQVSGFQAANLLRFQNSNGTLVNTSPLDNAAYTELLALIAGSSAQYTKSSSSSGSLLPIVSTGSGNVGTPLAGSIWLDTHSGTGVLKYFDGTSVQTLGLANNPQLTVTTAGNVGIGTTTPTDTVDIRAPANMGLRLVDDTTGNGMLITASSPAIHFNSYYDGTTDRAIGPSYTVSEYQSTSNGALIERIGNNPGAGQPITWSETFTLLPTGYAGFGLIDPQSPLEIAALGTTAGTNEQLTLRSARASIVSGNLIGGVNFKSNDSSYTAPGLQVALIQAIASGTHTTAAAPTDLVFTTTSVLTPSEKMRLTASGNVGLGTSVPTAKLDLQGGQIRTVSSTGSSYSNTSAAVDWNHGNSQSLSADCLTTSFTNALDGGHYYLLVTNTTADQCVFSQTGLTFGYSPANAARTAGKVTLYEFDRIGSYVAVTWRVLN